MITLPVLTLTSAQWSEGLVLALSLARTFARLKRLDEGRLEGVALDALLYAGRDYDPGRGEWGPRVRTITWQELVKEAKRQGRERALRCPLTVDLRDEREGPEEVVVRGALFDGLPLEARLYFLDGFTYSEIGLLLGLTGAGARYRVLARRSGRS